MSNLITLFNVWGKIVTLKLVIICFANLFYLVRQDVTFNIRVNI